MDGFRWNHIPVDILGEVAIAVGCIGINNALNTAMPKYQGPDKDKKLSDSVKRVVVKSVVDTAYICAVTAGCGALNDAIDNAIDSSKCSEIDENNLGFTL